MPIIAENSLSEMLSQDVTLRLLQIAKSRLIGLRGHVPQKMVFLQADALDLPFKPRFFQTIMLL
jgi:hypothetical protein